MFADSSPDEIDIKLEPLPAEYLETSREPLPVLDVKTESSCQEPETAAAHPNPTLKEESMPMDLTPIQTESLNDGTACQPLAFVSLNCYACLRCKKSFRQAQRLQLHALECRAKEPANARKSRISPKQQLMLVNFMHKHPGFARNELERSTHKRLWAELACKLNACEDGVAKDPSRWQKSWQDWKCKVKTKAAAMSGAPDNGHGGPGLFFNLLEQRCLEVITADASLSPPEIGTDSVEASANELPVETPAEPYYFQAEPSLKRARDEEEEDDDDVDSPGADKDSLPRPRLSSPSLDEASLSYVQARISIEEQRLQLAREQLSIEEQRLQLAREHYVINRANSQAFVSVMDKVANVADALIDFLNK